MRIKTGTRSNENKSFFPQEIHKKNKQNKNKTMRNLTFQDNDKTHLERKNALQFNNFYQQQPKQIEYNNSNNFFQQPKQIEYNNSNNFSRQPGQFNQTQYYIPYSGNVTTDTKVTFD
jgi:hypothetical protein